jgi:mono/diheme cytochrome c family protein
MRGNFRLLRNLAFYLSLLIFTLISCSGEKKSSRGSSKGENNKTVVQAEELSDDLQQGLDIYKRYCLSCHQSKGSGVYGMYPPLSGNPDLKGSSDSLITYVLRGKAGKIVVNGNDYSGIMPPQNYLSNEQVSLVLNYLLNGMNKLEKQISFEDVKAIRRTLK